ALESALVPVSGAGLLSLVAAARRLAVPAAGTTADSLAVVGRAGRRTEVMNADARRARVGARRRLPLGARLSNASRSLLAFFRARGSGRFRRRFRGGFRGRLLCGSGLLRRGL